MILEILIVLDIIGFVFLALGIIPFGERNVEGSNLPLVNKVIFLLIATIIFFSIAMTSVSYDYTYCYVNETVSDFTANSTLTTATCESFTIESMGLSYINWGMGLMSLTLVVIITMLALASKNDSDYMDN